MSFSFKKMDIPEVVLIGHETYDDERGSFAEIYKHSDFRQFGINKQFIELIW